MSLNESIGDNQTGTYTVTRTSPGSWLLGRFTPGSTSTFPIDASVQAIDGLTLQDDPVGQFSEEQKLLLTATMLHTQVGENPPDFVSVPNDLNVMETWRVDKVGKLDHWGETHYEVIITRYVLP